MNWRDHILNDFQPGIARLILVADPDGLMVEEGILQGIQERGFELIPFDDPIAFRFVYESKYRSRWDRGEMTDLVVVLRSETDDLSSLPYDLLQAGRKLSFNLGDLFPNLSYPIVAALDRGDLDTLFQAQQTYAPERMGDNATRDFVLRHVFGIAPELIRESSDLLRVLLRRHHQHQRIPKVLDLRFIQLLKQNSQLNDWPLEEIVSDREAFFIFLQERWPIFLDSLAKGKGSGVSDVHEPYALTYPTPVEVPFGHDDVRVYIDNLFVEGMLQPISHRQSTKLAGLWVAVGLKSNTEEDRLRRFQKLMSTVEQSIPDHQAKYQSWLHLAHQWAELTALRIEVGNSGVGGNTEEILALQDKIDSAFLGWVQNRYGGLHNQPPVPPVMLHHIPRFLARILEGNNQTRVAVVVLDGLSMDQWVVIRNVVRDQRPDLHFREEAAFAWIPTITPVSRQAIFSGRPPMFFPDSIETTNKEPAHWNAFWSDCGLQPAQVFYERGLGDDLPETVRDALSTGQVRAAGLVVDKVDRIMHGMQLGSAGMHNQARQWAEQGFLWKLIDLLIHQKFQVFITSDHGNIEAMGCGRPGEGALADVRGERARIYSDQILRTRVKEDFPEAVVWDAIGLPEGYWPLLAPGRKAFITEGKKTIGHGGISVEELIVPFVRVEHAEAESAIEVGDN